MECSARWAWLAIICAQRPPPSGATRPAKPSLQGTILQRRSMFNRLNRALQQHLDPNRPLPSPRQPTIEDLLPGDVVSFWDAGDSVVQSVLECREELNRRETAWRWNILDEGKVLEISPDGTWLYERTDVLHQTSTEFETLTADPS